MKEKLLFAAHGGTYKGHRAAIIMQEHCLPIACSHRSIVAEVGLHACWEAHADTEEFFAHLCIDGIRDTGPETKPDG